MPASDWSAFRATAVELARLGGTFARARQVGAVVRRKGDQSPVTDIDHAAQALILDELARRHPDHAVLVEEHVANPGRHAPRDRARFCWVVDPIDGTRNFSRGSPLFATAVAVLCEGVPVAGAIYDGASGAVYSASQSGGASRDHAPLELPDRPIGPDTSVAFSSFRLHPVPRGIRALFDEILFRNIGSACLHQAWVAAGQVDAVYSPDTKVWDVAAGALLIAEAGGQVTDASGAPRWPWDVTQADDTLCSLLAGAPRAHAHVLDCARE